MPGAFVENYERACGVQVPFPFTMLLSVFGGRWFRLTEVGW